MVLTPEIIKSFVKAATDTTSPSKSEGFVYGTAKDIDGVCYLCIDGSSIKTPMSSGVEVSDGDRVMGLVKNHTVTVISNYSAPAVNTSTFGTYKELVTEDFKAVNANIEHITGSLAEYETIISKEIQSINGQFETLNSKYASIDFANIDIANINKANVAELFATMGLISTAVIENGHVTGYLDSVEVNANRITAGTLSVDRLIINGSEKSLIYALNNAGELVSTSVDTLDGDLITERTVTADKLVAHSITANEITTSNIIGASGWINLAQGTFNYGNQISWDGSRLYIAPESIFVAVGDRYASKDYVDSIKVGARNLIRNAKTLDFETYCFGGRTKFIADESGNRLTDENGAYLIA